MKWTPAGMWGAMSRTTAALTEPTSETVAPGLRCGPISFATAPQAPIGTQTITRSAFFDRVRAGVDDRVGEPQFADALPRRLGARRRNDFAHDAERARRARDRAADQADADQRQAVIEDWRSHHCRPMNSFSAATTSRLASSVPTLSRNAFGNL